MRPAGPMTTAGLCCIVCFYGGSQWSGWEGEGSAGWELAGQGLCLPLLCTRMQLNLGFSASMQTIIPAWQSCCEG